MPITVRSATTDDLDWLMKELEVFSRSYPSKLSLYGDGIYARGAMATLIRDHICFVAENVDGERLGFIAGLVSPHLFNPTIRVLTECFWWVPERHRRTRAALLLLNEFTTWGKENVEWITLAIQLQTPIREMSLIKRGFTPTERHYLMEVS